MMAREKPVKQTIHRYSIVDKLSGKRENIKDVILTYCHNGLIELITIGNDCLVYEKERITIEKY